MPLRGESSGDTIDILHDLEASVPADYLVRDVEGDDITRLPT